MVFYAVVLLFAYVVAATLLLLHIAQIKQKVARALVLLQTAALNRPCTHSTVHGASAVLTHTCGRLLGLLGDTGVVHPCQHRRGRFELCMRSCGHAVEEVHWASAIALIVLIHCNLTTAGSASEHVLGVELPARCLWTHQH